MAVATIRPLQRPVPLRQSVYDALIDLIVGGELPPGQHMVETDLAHQLGVSRQPIREALHRMEAEGWVDLRPSQGAFVHVPTDSEVDELLDVRALLEAETARLAAARRVTPAQLARLREICRDGEAAAEAGDFGTAVAANNAFHTEVAAVGGNAVLAELADIVGRRVQWYYRMVAPERGQRVVDRARGDDRGHRVGRRRPGPDAGPQAHRADPAGLSPYLIQWFALFRSTSGTSPTLRVPTARTGSNGPCSLVGSE